MRAIDPFSRKTSEHSAATTSDAAVEHVAVDVAQRRWVNSWQSCIAAKRLIIEDAIADRFEEAFVAAMERTVIGDPMDRRTETGPMARADLRETLHQQVEPSRKAGAQLLTGGHPLDRARFFDAPTVLAQAVCPAFPPLSPRQTFRATVEACRWPTSNAARRPEIKSRGGIRQQNRQVKSGAPVRKESTPSTAGSREAEVSGSS